MIQRDREWKVRYEPGAIEARASRGGAVVVTAKRETTGDAANVRLTADRTEIDADGEDVSILKVEVVDAQGRVVPTANNRVSFRVSGPGTLIGVGNGDPNCQESDKEPRRSVFNGLAQVIIQSTKQPGEIRVEAVKSGWGGQGASPTPLVITAKQVQPRASVPLPAQA